MKLFKVIRDCPLYDIDDLFLFNSLIGNNSREVMATPFIMKHPEKSDNFLNKDGQFNLVLDNVCEINFLINSSLVI